MKTLSRLFVGAASSGISVAVLSGALLIAAPSARAQDTPAAPAVPATPAAAAVSDSSWTTFKGDRQRTGGSTANISLPLSLQWRFSSTGPARTYITAPLVIGAPGRQNVVFASGPNIYALDAATGGQVWKSPDLPSSILVPLTLLPTDAGDMILAMQSSGRLAAIKSADGGRAWETDTGALVTESGPIVAQTNNGARIIWRAQYGQAGRAR